ncbi:MAG: hypothetical protein Q9191_000564 [Dirinaria sp. TL-2023a]
MSASPTSKRIKTSPPLIGTHSGQFHADEALAVYLLRLLPTYSPSALIRTRDPALLSTCHTVVDVGGEYDPPANRYDHHQRTFNTTFPSRPTKLSSAGLVFLHFGKPIIARQTGLAEASPEVGILWRKVYEEFIEALDAHDNGIAVYDPAETRRLTKRFNDGGIGLGSLVADLNAWDDDEEEEQRRELSNPEQVQEAEDTRFLQASELMGSVFLRKLRYYHRHWWPARQGVRECYARRKENDSRGRIMVFERGMPWKDHLYTFEAENSSEEEVLYVLYPEGEHEGSKWRIQAVPVSKDSFESRKALPEAWRGVRDDELDKVSGIEGGVFVHASGFIGGNKTKGGALAMAKQALEI